MVTLLTGTFTVKVTVSLIVISSLYAAVIVAFPPPTKLTLPVLSTVAAFSLSELHTISGSGTVASSSTEAVSATESPNVYVVTAGLLSMVTPLTGVGTK